MLKWCGHSPLPSSLSYVEMHLCFPLQIARAWFANVAHQDFFICFFSVILSFREWNSFCACSLLLHIHLLDYCSPETLTVFFFLYWWVQFVALISPDAIILCPTHATLCFNFQTIALTCSILRSYLFIEALFLCLPLYLQFLCRVAAANFMDS